MPVSFLRPIHAGVCRSVATAGAVGVRLSRLSGCRALNLGRNLSRTRLEDAGGDYKSRRCNSDRLKMSRARRANGGPDHEVGGKMQPMRIKIRSLSD